MNYDLTLAGINLPADADLDLTKISVDGEGGTARTLAAGTISVAEGTHTAKKHVYRLKDNTTEGLFNRNGFRAADNEEYKLTLAKDWVATGSGAANTEGIMILASGFDPTAITDADYDSSTGALVITGTGFPTAMAGLDFTKLKFADDVESMALTAHNGTPGTNTSTGSALSATGVTITMKGTDKAKADAILNTNGTNNGASTAVDFNLIAEAGFFVGQPNLADTKGNGIEVSKVPAFTRRYLCY